MDWSPHIRDLNRIDDLWSILDARSMSRRVNNKRELFNLLDEEWNTLPGVPFERLVASIPKICQALVDAKGYDTKY